MSGAQKSLDLVTELLNLLAVLFSDIANHHPHLRNELTLDFRTLTKRSLKEGESFITQTLPKLARAVYNGLETQVFECPSNFARAKGTVLPRFMGGLLKSVFSNDGKLLTTIESSALVDCLQILLLAYKLELPYTAAKQQKVIDAFKSTEVLLDDLQLDDDDVLEAASALVDKVLRGFNPKNIVPQHGPGAVATRERGLEKWKFKRKYAHIHRVYPYYEYYTPSRPSLLRNIPRYRELELHESGTARVVLVPKDSRGPRLISMEPLEYQFIQQGLARALVRQIETKSSITRGKLNFTDQSVNRNLALWNSTTRRYATLDMKEASDRVSLQLVQKVFAKRPDVLKCLEATRTTQTELPSGEILPLKKFAPMGSALCFPVEALVFFALAKVLAVKYGVHGQVYVYGDDIIVDAKLAPILAEHFPKYGLMFNESKCFSKGYFRESCGLDAYKGFICTPIRLRKLLPNNRKQVSQIVGSVEFSNHLYLRGYWKTAFAVRERLEKVVRIGTYRSPNVEFGGLSFASFITKGVITEDKVRYNRQLQSFETRTYTARQCYVDSKSQDFEGRLFKCLLGRHTERWERIEVPHASSLKLRWIPLYS